MNNEIENEQKHKKKKLNIFSAISDKLKFKTGSAFDDMDSRDKIRQEFKENRNKKFIGFGILVIIVFIILVIMSAINSYRNAELAYTEKEERKSVDIKTDNFAIWQAGAEQKINDLESTLNQGLTKQAIDISDIKDAIKELGNTIVLGFQKSNKDTDGLEKRISSLSDDMQKKILELNNKIQNQGENIEAAKAELNRLLNEANSSLRGDLESLKTQVGEVKIAEATPDEASQDSKKVGFPSDGDKKQSSNGNNQEGDLATLEVNQVRQKLKVTIEQKEADDNGDEETQRKEEIKFKVLLGLSKGILLNGADASILGFGRQEEAPVAISLLSKVSIANGEYSNLKDCLLLGSAIGSMTTQRAQIRLEKISCIFTNQEGDKFLAEGQVKGWVTDENGSLGVTGGLITQEGKIIRSALPLAMIQTALDYVTRRATNVVIPTGGGYNGYSNFNAAFGSGGASAANTTLGKITEIYQKMIQAQVPVINFKPGREITVLFQGGEDITLVPYKDQQGLGEMEGDFMHGREKYNYQEANNVFMEEN